MNDKEMYEELVHIIQTYLDFNASCDHVDGLLINRSQEISLVVLDEIYELGDYYPIEDLINVEELANGTRMIPNERKLREIAQKYV